MSEKTQFQILYTLALSGAILMAIYSPTLAWICLGGTIVFASLVVLKR
jgi:hypothetical protein